MIVYKIDALNHRVNEHSIVAVHVTKATSESIWIRDSAGRESEQPRHTQHCEHYDSYQEAKKEITPIA